MRMRYWQCWVGWLKLVGQVSHESYESPVFTGMLLLSMMMKTMGPEVQVCWMWQSYIPRTGNSNSFLVCDSKGSKVWETFGKHLKKKLVGFEPFANMTWVNLGITHWAFSWNCMVCNGVSNQSICISTDQSEGKCRMLLIYSIIQYKYFKKLKAAGPEQSQSCLQWPCFCCFLGRGTSCDWWEFVWVRR